MIRTLILTLALCATTMSTLASEYEDAIKKALSHAGDAKPVLLQAYGMPESTSPLVFQFQERYTRTKKDPFARVLKGLPEVKETIVLPGVRYFFAPPKKQADPLFGETATVKTDPNTTTPTGMMIYDLSQNLNYGRAPFDPAKGEHMGIDIGWAHQFNNVTKTVGLSKDGQWYVNEDMLLWLCRTNHYAGLKPDPRLKLPCVYVGQRDGKPAVVYTDFWGVTVRGEKRVDVNTGASTTESVLELPFRFKLEHSICKEMITGDVQTLLQARFIENPRLVPWDDAMAFLERTVKSRNAEYDKSLGRTLLAIIAVRP